MTMSAASPGREELNGTVVTVDPGTIHDDDGALTEVVIEDLWVAEAGFETYSRADVQVIIGRSVLRKGTFTYNGWDSLFTFEVTSP